MPIANEAGTTSPSQSLATKADPRSARTGLVASFSDVLGVLLQSSAATLLQTAHSTSTASKPRSKSAVEQTPANNTAPATASSSILTASSATTVPVSVPPIVIDNPPTLATPDSEISEAPADLSTQQSAVPVETIAAPVNSGGQSAASGFLGTPSQATRAARFPGAGFEIPGSTTYTTWMPPKVSELSTMAPASSVAPIRAAVDGQTNSTGDAASIASSTDFVPQSSESVQFQQPPGSSIAASQISTLPALGQPALQTVPQSGEPIEASPETQPSSDASSQVVNGAAGDTPLTSAVEYPAPQFSRPSAMTDEPGATDPTSTVPSVRNDMPGPSLAPAYRKQEAADGASASISASTIPQAPSAAPVTSVTAQSSVASNIIETPGAAVAASPATSTSTVLPDRNNSLSRAPNPTSGSRRQTAAERSDALPRGGTNNPPPSDTAPTIVSIPPSVVPGSTGVGVSTVPIADAPPLQRNTAADDRPSARTGSETSAKPNADDNSAAGAIAFTSDSNTGSSSQNPNTGSDKTFAAVWNPTPATPAGDPLLSPATIFSSAAINGAQIDVPKITESVSSTVSPHGSSADSVARQMANESPELSAGLQSWNGGENLRGDVTQAAHLMAKAGQSEMNIAMQAELLGAVQVRAHMSGDQVGAAITVERHEAHAFLNNDLPALHQALSERQIRLEKISVDQGSPLASGTATDGSGQQQSQNGFQQRSLYSGGSARDQSSSALMNSTFTDTTDTTDIRVAFDSDGRLSVRA
jgi:hypothetical protein